MNRQRTALMVDAAQFFLFHPLDYTPDQCRLDPPADALSRGYVIGLQLGADGNRIVEITRELTAEDRADIDGQPWVFPLAVKHGRLFATDRIAAIDDYNWDREACLEIEPGVYRAAWYALGEEAVPRRNLNWIVVLEPVASLEGIATWPELPHEDDPRTPPQPAGRRVHHAKFGEGVVIHEAEGKVTVDFGGERKTIKEEFLRDVE